MQRNLSVRIRASVPFSWLISGKVLSRTRRYVRRSHGACVVTFLELPS
jgi:hypothetical protein